ncbi:hypothetical protein EH223_05500 [candidate division KSB1 bacterium]|nr:hypothetical protein [candidate division KSB1 bacterium]RQW05217.1 MAG: hypothetical protein EH223_05500 [candidate division KSB1 bacterium]
MYKHTLPDWEKYWANFDDKNLLLQKADNLDETLQLIEKEFDKKLLSGDHMMILDALDDRIDELNRIETAKRTVVQTNLFENV